jgi:anti-sigma factor RsiW
MNDHALWADRLSEYVDGELAVAERRGVEAHLAGCAECREALGELQAVANRARSLTDQAPAADLWPAIATRIGGDSQRGPRVLELRAARRFSFTLPQLVAASLALMVMSGGMVWLARLGGERTDIPGINAVAPSPGSTPAAVAVLPATFAEAHYDEAIADLQQTLEADRARLDPETVRVLERSLIAIDSAIEECRRALAADPANRYLSDSLVAAKKRKLGLLRRATALAEDRTSGS